MSDLWRLIGLFRPYWGWMALSIFLSLATVLANVALMATAGWFITAMGLAGVAGVAMNYFTPAALIRAFALTRTGGRYAERVVSHEATFRLLAHLRVWLYQRLEPLAPAVLGGYRSADLSTRMQGDIDRLEQVFLRLISPVIVALISSLVVVGFVTAYSPTLAVAIAGLLLLAGVVLPALSWRLGRRHGVAFTERSADLNVMLTDTIEGLGELEAYGAIGHASRQAEAAGDDVIGLNQRLKTNDGLALAGVGLAANCALVAALVIVIPHVAAGKIAGPELVMLALLALATFEAIVPIPVALQTLSGTLASARRIFSLADADPLVREPDKPVTMPPDRTLRFDQVTFRYPGSREPVLSNVDLVLEPGRHVGVLGASGAGKSSLINLAMRFYEPTSGQITLGGEPICGLRSEDVRAQISVAAQNDHLFTATIAENLRLAKPDAPLGQLEQVCRIALLHDFIAAQPDGYDTFVGAAGEKLSGGELRRLSIARALLKDAPIVILDEPTEGLDADLERRVMQSVLEACRDKAVLVITHRPAGLELLDEIVVLENGEIVSREFPQKSG